MTPRRPALAASAPLLVLGLALTLGGCSTTGPSIAVPNVTLAPTVAPNPTAAPATAPAASPTPTPVSGTAACDPANLSAAIVSWDAGAGHRNATVALTNNGKANCTIHVLATPQLVGADGKILIQGKPPSSAATTTLAYYDTVKTMVSAANYCGATTPALPVTVAFVFPGGEGRVVAAPAPGDTAAGVPPCNGDPGSPGDVEMQPFGP